MTSHWAAIPFFSLVNLSLKTKTEEPAGSRVRASIRSRRPSTWLPLMAKWSKEGFLLFVSGLDPFLTEYMSCALGMLSANSRASVGPVIQGQMYQLISVDTSATHLQLSSAQHMFYFVFDSLLLLFSFKCLLILENISKQKRTIRISLNPTKPEIIIVSAWRFLVCICVCILAKVNTFLQENASVGKYVSPVVRMLRCELSTL